MTKAAVDWKALAPKRADWERLNALCAKKGIPQPHWLNGIPTGLTDKDLQQLAKLAAEPETKKVRSKK